MRGIRQVASIPIPTLAAADLGLEPAAVGRAAAKVQRLDYFVPPEGGGAEMLDGDDEETIDKLIELVRTKGGVK
jgi:electron transfer flavoprotein beta subunit